MTWKQTPSGILVPESEAPTETRCLPGRCQRCGKQACLKCRARIEPELEWEKTTYVLGDCTTCSPVSADDGVFGVDDLD